MKLVNALKGLWTYFGWEKETRDLCHAGKDITHAINDRFADLEREAIVSFIEQGNFPQVLPELQTPLSLRKQYWLTKQPDELTAKMASYPTILERRFAQYEALGDPGSAFGVFVWLHSAIDIAKGALERGMLARTHYDLLVDKANALIRQGVQYFQDGAQRNVSAGIYHDGILESGARYVVRHLAHNLKNIFRIVEPDGRSFFLEVFEKWDFGERRISVCVPIAIGCPNRCHACNFSASIPHHRSLTANEIFNLIYTNAIINDDVTSLFFRPEELTIYYLGGGDPGNNVAEIEKVIQMVHQFYYRKPGLPFVEWIRNNQQRAGGNQSAYPFRQVVSTIGLDNGSLDRLIDFARTIPELGIQVSINAFNERARAYTIKNLKGVMSIERCVRTAERFYDVTSGTEHPRKAYLSVFLLQDVYDDAAEILTDVKKLNIDKARCHITLDVLRYTPEQFAHKSAPIGRYKAVCRQLRREGYSASIYYPPEDGSTEEGCGVISSYLLQKMNGQRRQVAAEI